MHGTNNLIMRRSPHVNRGLEGRDLLGLPLSLGLSLDIPILDTLLSPLTAGPATHPVSGAQTQTPTSPSVQTSVRASDSTPAATPTPTPTPSPAPGTTPAQGHTSPLTSAAGDTPNAGGATSVINGGGGSDASNTSQLSPNLQGKSSSDVSPSPTNVKTDNGIPSLSPAIVPTSGPGTLNTASISDAGRVSSEGSLIPTASLSAVVNTQGAEGGPVSTNASGQIGALTASTAQQTGSSSSSLKGPNNSGSGSGTGDSGGNGDVGSGSPGDSNHHGLLKGVIVAIAVIGALVILLLLLFLVRRSSISRRMTRRRRWFRSATALGTPVSSDEYFPQNRNSRSSSFETTTDRGQRPHSEAPFDWSWPPQHMVQSLSYTTSQSPVSLPLPVPTADSLAVPVVRPAVTENSANQSAERSTSQLSQYLVVSEKPTADGAAALVSVLLPSPISVRPFTPSESWHFPKPPNGDSRHQSQTSLPKSNELKSSAIATANSSSSRNSLSSSEESPDLDPENPFSDLASVDTHNSHFTSNTAVTDPSTTEHFNDVEIIRRPFTPNMSDELAVSPGDEVRVKRTYDDGWAYGEKLKEGTRGMFPLDCLRMKDQTLVAFLTQKRISSYTANPFIDNALR